jgi:hypothetical protein
MNGFEYAAMNGRDAASGQAGEGPRLLTSDHKKGAPWDAFISTSS